MTPKPPSFGAQRRLVPPPSAAAGAQICCLDLEGVLVPEIWIAVARKTRISSLRLTTRDEPNYDLLMRRRLEILRKNKITLRQIQKIIATLRPLPGAASFLKDLRRHSQVIVLSDTYYEFAGPLMEKLGRPTLFCNWLEVDAQGYIRRYRLRQKDGKARIVETLKNSGFYVQAAGDSYNDVTMLSKADRGVLFRPPERMVREYPQFQVARTHTALLLALSAFV
ncbi:MAG: bifunctional phosphoserine phosphatase/homoserine phosphotransferase ThrH [Candidatus Omnitrophica bacterium]|nr:bifunctional phosphoserine phosphatase/homoserine phosphotransferase ThrH [Candidatus Omnitrophota bacterium]